ncbi:DUF3592 domain-containing protein [Breznakiellaceae bacterium SP9]
MLVFVGIFALICLFFGFMMFYSIVKKIRAISAVGDSTEGLVTKSELAEETETMDDGVPYKYYRADIAYEYRVDGVKHSSGNIYSDAAITVSMKVGATLKNGTAAFQNGGRNRSIIEDVVMQYPTGAKVTVFYNPKKPEQSYLEKVSRKNSIGLIAMLFFAGIVLTGFGVVMVLFILNGGEPL